MTPAFSHSKKPPLTPMSELGVLGR
jgi:hypothetical protein